MEHHLIKQHALQRGYAEFIDHRDRMRQPERKKKRLFPLGLPTSTLGGSLTSFLDFLPTPSGGKLLAPERDVARVSTLLKAFCISNSLDDVCVDDFLLKHKELCQSGGIIEIFCKYRRASTMRRYIQSRKRYVTFILTTSDDDHTVMLARKAHNSMANW